MIRFKFVGWIRYGKVFMIGNYVVSEMDGPELVVLICSWWDYDGWNDLDGIICYSIHGDIGVMVIFWSWGYLCLWKYGHFVVGLRYRFLFFGH